MNLEEIIQGGDKFLHAPAWLLLIVALNLLGWFMQQYPIWPNGWNRAIGYILILLGVILAPLVIPLTVFTPDQPHPKTLLAIIGGIFGIIAFCLHATLVQWLLGKFVKPDNETKPPTAP